MFSVLRSFALKYTGIDQVIDQIINKLGVLDCVLLTGGFAEGKSVPIIDLIIVGAIDKTYLQILIEKVEITINKKIRVAVYRREEFTDEILTTITHWVDLLK